MSKAYDANMPFGDIVKVTPTSKVVGDMALFMVTNDLTPADVADSATDRFPTVVQCFRGFDLVPRRTVPRGAAVEN